MRNGKAAGVSQRALGLQWGRTLAWLDEAERALEQAHSMRTLFPFDETAELVDVLNRVRGLSQRAWRLEELSRNPRKGKRK